LATLPTLDESGVAVRQTGDRDPHRGIRISDAPAGGPQPASVAPSVPAVAASAPAPWTRAKGLQAVLWPRWHRGVGGREATSDAPRRWVIRCGPPRSVKGLLVGPRRPAPRPRARRGALVLRHHHYRVRRHRNHHHNRSRPRHHHLGVICPRGSSSNNNNSSSNSSGRPASRVAGKFRVPSECNPFFH
jgi:hypothetical protein